MKNEIVEKLINTLLDIEKNLESVPFWKDWNFWGFVALMITLYFLIRYTRATEKMAKYQIIPAIDVNMCYDTSSKKTYFWFSNSSNLPGIVHLKHKKNKEAKRDTYTPLRVPPRRSMKTANADFGFSPSEGDKITLYVVVTPAMDNSKSGIKFEKSYKFINSQWKETSWNFSDPSFPG